jgi:hypothetical protein
MTTDEPTISPLHLDFLTPEGRWVEVPMRAGADLVILRPDMIGKPQRVPMGDAGWHTYRLRYDLPLD